MNTGAPQPGAEQLAQRQVGQRHVDRRDDAPAVLELYDRRHPDPHRAPPSPSARARPARPADRRAPWRSTGSSARSASRRDARPFILARGNLGAAEVDADQLAHSCDAAAASSRTVRIADLPPTEHRSRHVWVRRAHIRARRPLRLRSALARYAAAGILEDLDLRSFPNDHTGALCPLSHKRQSPLQPTDRGARRCLEAPGSNSDGSPAAALPRAFRLLSAFDRPAASDAPRRVPALASRRARLPRRVLIE